MTTPLLLGTTSIELAIRLLEIPLQSAPLVFGHFVASIPAPVVPTTIAAFRTGLLLLLTAALLRLGLHVPAPQVPRTR